MKLTILFEVRNQTHRWYRKATDDSAMLFQSLTSQLDRSRRYDCYDTSIDTLGTLPPQLEAFYCDIIRTD